MRMWTFSFIYVPTDECLDLMEWSNDAEISDRRSGSRTCHFVLLCAEKESGRHACQDDRWKGGVEEQRKSNQLCKFNNIFLGRSAQKSSDDIHWENVVRRNKFLRTTKPRSEMVYLS